MAAESRKNGSINGNPSLKKMVFVFGKGRSEGNKSMKALLGGKGANLAEMASIGLSIPPRLTISTEACEEYVLGGKEIPHSLWEDVLRALRVVENETRLMQNWRSQPPWPLNKLYY